MTTDTLQELMLKAASLTDDEKLSLVIHLLEQTRLGAKRGGNRWRDIRGLLPDLMDGQDAQEWVTRSRR